MRARRLARDADRGRQAVRREDRTEQRDEHDHDEQRHADRAGGIAQQPRDAQRSPARNAIPRRRRHIGGHDAVRNLGTRSITMKSATMLSRMIAAARITATAITTVRSRLATDLDEKLTDAGIGKESLDDDDSAEQVSNRLCVRLDAGGQCIPEDVSPQDSTPRETVDPGHNWIAVSQNLHDAGADLTCTECDRDAQEG